METDVACTQGMEQVNTYVHIQIDDSGEDRCLFTRELFQALELSPATVYELCLGYSRAKVRVQEIEGCVQDTAITHCLILSSALLQELGLSPGMKLNIWKQSEAVSEIGSLALGTGERICLGPVIGVMVHSAYMARLGHGRPPLSVQKLIQANKKAHCFLYFFSPEQVQWTSNRIEGYIYNANKNKWMCNLFPFPTIVYDRGLGFGGQQVQQVQQTRKCLHNIPGLRFINPMSLEKWSVHQCLAQNPHLQPFLPETILFSRFNDVKNMLNKHGYVFIKPILGYHGRKVLSLQKRGKHCSAQFVYKGPRKITLTSWKAVRKLVQRIIGEETSVVQQGIRVFQHHGANMDMRLLLVKDRHAHWHVIYNRARLATGSFPVLNSRIAKRIIPYDQIYTFSASSPTTPLPPPHYIREVVVDIARQIEQVFGAFGEMGVDMALDYFGRLWFVEANSKPNKNPHPELEDETSVSPQFLSVLEYAKSLEGVKNFE